MSKMKKVGANNNSNMRIGMIRNGRRTVITGTGRLEIGY